MNILGPTRIFGQRREFFEEENMDMIFGISQYSGDEELALILLSYFVFNN